MLNEAGKARKYIAKWWYRLCITGYLHPQSLLFLLLSPFLSLSYMYYLSLCSRSDGATSTLLWRPIQLHPASRTDKNRLARLSRSDSDLNIRLPPATTRFIKENILADIFLLSVSVNPTSFNVFSSLIEQGISKSRNENRKRLTNPRLIKRTTVTIGITRDISIPDPSLILDTLFLWQIWNNEIRMVASFYFNTRIWS